MNESYCERMFDCCDCGGNDCGCCYCFSCNACDSCLCDDDNCENENIIDWFIQSGVVENVQRD